MLSKIYLVCKNGVLLIVFAWSGFLWHSTLGAGLCQLHDGQCTYNINLATAENCPPPLDIDFTHQKPEAIRSHDDKKMNQMQQDFSVVTADHENRLRELENSIQKVLRNAIPQEPVEYSSRHIDAAEKDRYLKIVPSHQSLDTSGNMLLLQLQNQFNHLRSQLGEKTADLLETRNKLNETADILVAVQKQAVEASNSLVGLETKLAVSERENNILKNKLKEKSERLDFSNEKLNTTESKLFSIENQLFDVVRSESTLREELETLKLQFEKTKTLLEQLQLNHTELNAKFKRTKRTLQLREEELMECYVAKTQTFCDFEDENLCGFTQENETDTFDWDRIHGRTPSANTGPEKDHTCKDDGGHFMYIEASGKSTGQTARLSSPKYRGLKPQCVEFYYHMYGRQVGTLAVYSKLLTSGELHALWRVFGNQGNLWIKAGVSVSEETARSGYQLVIEGTTDLGYEGDISIDDISVRDGQCNADKSSSQPTLAPPPSESQRSKLLQEQIERYRQILKERQRERNQRNQKLQTR